mmetsp:Transcript_1848/g.3554  ORF Transcript_1848/g.3554 Transcript_1848/m.3554 type:complete len:351 (-) Transcript_1848:197-1249(-)
MLSGVRPRIAFGGSVLGFVATVALICWTVRVASPLASPASTGLRTFKGNGGQTRGTSRLISRKRNALRCRASEDRDVKNIPDATGKEGTGDASKKLYFVTLGVGSYLDYDRVLRSNPRIRLDQKKYVKSKMEDDTLVAYGPLRGLIFPPTTPQDVGLWVLRANDLEEAKEVVKKSPYCENSITSGCKIIHVNPAVTERRNLENQDNLEDIQKKIEEVRREVEASQRVHQLLQNELDAAHTELKNARAEYDKYNREVNLQRFDWLSSGSLETIRRLRPVYEGLDQLQATKHARTPNEAAIEEMYATIARNFINLYEQELDGVKEEKPIAKWVTKVFGSPSNDIGTREEGGE